MLSSNPGPTQINSAGGRTGPKSVRPGSARAGPNRVKVGQGLLIDRYAIGTKGNRPFPIPRHVHFKLLSHQFQNKNEQSYKN